MTKKKRKSSLAGAAVALVLLCCGGGSVIGAFADDDTPAGREQTGAAQGSFATSTPRATPMPRKSVDDGGDEASPAPTRSTARPVPRKSTTKPTPKRTTGKPRKTTTEATPATRQGVRAGAFCKPAGAFGRTSTGKLMVCKRTATDSRNRWRAA